MNVLYFILLLVGLVLFLGAAFGVRPASNGRSVDLVALGLACWIAVSVIATARIL